MLSEVLSLVVVCTFFAQKMEAKITFQGDFFCIYGKKVRAFCAHFSSIDGTYRKVYGVCNVS